MNPMQDTPSKRTSLALLAAVSVAGQLAGAAFVDPDSDRNALPGVPPGFEVSFFAREPMVRQPCSMAFDAKGRLCVGMGPQYRNPKPGTPGDSVVLVLDDDGDGQADRTKTLATGFNAIQGLAWHGRDLWVANAPDLTVVRDLDGDDEADEYVRVYTDLGNLEHGLHGLNWAPDGRLYMSKGNSKGLTQPGRVAPKPFRDLWGVTAPAGSPDFPTPQSFRKDGYQKAYHDPDDDWGREGGVLRCEDGGVNLEIVARGFRNPWDITFDSGFNWLATDNDQTDGDRVLMPFFGANFGWNHPWSAHWGDDAHPPSAPVSGPLFEGSGTGVVFGDPPQFPPSHRGVFFINDWLRKTTFLWRPRWDGALLRSVGEWEPFVTGGGSLFRPTDLEVGPDGALWILGWSAGYGAEFKDGDMTSEGRVFRIVSKSSPTARWQTPKRSRPLAQWTVPELVEEFDGPLPVWRIDAQDELVRRGSRVKTELMQPPGAHGHSEARETWVAWTLGRLSPHDASIDGWFGERVAAAETSLNLRVQSLRILGFRAQRHGAEQALPTSVVNALENSNPRVRFEAIQALGQARQSAAIPAILNALALEADPTTFYAGWQTLRRLQPRDATKSLLADSRANVRQAALLASLEDHAMSEPEVRVLTTDTDAAVRTIAALWLDKAAAGGEKPTVRGRPLAAETPAPASTAPRIGLARNIQARSGARYTLASAGLRAGARCYTDRAYDLRRIPDALVDLDFIQTANEDDASQGEGWLTFEALMPVRVHVALDTRAAVPGWLRERFQRTEQTIRADHWTFALHTREFPAGRIALGGNTDDGNPGGKGNYIVLLEPLALAPPPAPATLEATLAALPQGDPTRGEWLFHAQGGAGCFNCHRLGEHGNRFGPDLAVLGDRATARHIVQSMLEPNAVVTEGFHLQTVETADAEFSGILIEESGLSLTLGLATGQRQIIPKPRITSRITAAASAMPAFDTVLTPQFVADLASYLMAQKAGTPAIHRADVPGVAAEPGDARRSGSVSSTAWPRGDGFRFAEQQDRLVLAHDGQPLGEFVFRDGKILRPYFANLHAPGGIQATRNHPPIAGTDAVDHDTMHPGLWLAFGDLSGRDFWRNQGRIEHVRFTERPAVSDGRLGFATECRLRTPEGRIVCALTNRFTLTAVPHAWLLIWDATFHPDDGDVTFGDQEEMGFGARVATAITEKNGGVITSSSGRTSAKGTWGQPADWCDYSGIVAGSPIGITLLADPGNFRPSWWHNRDYGVLVANPFGRAAMKQGDPSVVTVKSGGDFRVRFGAVIHSGKEFNPGAAFESFRAAARR
ncbi:MAG: PmoA family protein [Verrucomicrobiales bacterium]|nr:PmoA family protein [Verrucomicrobiales bacterium]